MTDFELLSTALSIARKAHEGQIDKSGEDYIFHPISVALQLETCYEKCTALLHDVLEDSDVTVEDMRKSGIPEEVLDALQLLNHTKDRGVDRETDYRNYIMRIRESGNPIAIHVKLADLTHNTDVNRLKGAKPPKYELYLWAVSYLSETLK